MSGRAATTNVIAGNYALSVGLAEMPTPKGWKWAALSDVARLESGHTPSREHDEYWNGDVPWIGIKDARTHHGGTINETFQTITSEGLHNSAARLLPPLTVCLSRTASVGYVVVMGREMATSQDFVNWICGPALDPYFLQKLFIAENESLFRFGKGSTHTTIYYPEVKAFHVCLPPIGEQRRIVAKLEALQARSRRAREALDAVPPLLEKLRQSILAAAFRGDLTKDWRAKNPDVEPASALLARIRAERRKKWEEAELAKLKAKGKPPTDDRWKAKYKEPEPVDTTGLPELPEGWCWASLDELLSSIESGRSPRAEGRAAGPEEPGVLKVSALSWGRFDPTENKALLPGEHIGDTPTVHAGDLLISRANTVQLVGAVAIADRDYPNLMLSDKTLRLVPASDDVSSELILYALRTRLVRRLFEGEATGTSDSMRNLSQDKILSVPIALPPAQETPRLVGALRDAMERTLRMFAVAEALKAQVDRLHGAILAKAFRGELVPQDPNDEPADVMLARLRSSEPEQPKPSSRRRSKPKAAE
jgi:type I restriction enzyme S subunit